MRHPGGRSWIDSDQNAVGQWSLRVDPEGLLVDAYHAEGPHIHDPANRDRRIPIGNVELVDVERIVREHLTIHGKVVVDLLARELRSYGN